MKQIFTVIIACVLSAGIAWSVAYTHPPDAHKNDNRESVYDRVIRTGVIRCAYFPYWPGLGIDPNTGEMSGIFYEVTEELGRRLGLEIKWAEEVGYGEMIQGFETGRYDMFCNTVWPTPERARSAGFSVPLYYSQVGVFVREDDRRFDGQIEKLNDPDVTLAVNDGDVSYSLAKTLFPEAEFFSLGQISSHTQLLLEVAEGRADATLNEPALLHRYNKHAPEKLRNIAAEKPLKYFPNSYMLPRKEHQLKQTIDHVLRDLIADGFVERAIAKHEQYPGMLLRPAVPFAAPDKGADSTDKNAENKGTE